MVGPMTSRWLVTGCAFLLVAASRTWTAPLQWETHPGFRVAAVTAGQPHRAGFSLLSAEQTGVRFTNQLSIESASKNHNLMQGAGVAAGDVDGDGLCDVYFCNI